jgi:hypothetical protein
MKKFKAHQLEFDEIINTTTSNEFAKKITMMSTSTHHGTEQRGNDEGDANDGGLGVGARLPGVGAQGGNEGAEEARDAAEHNNGNNRNNSNSGDIGSDRNNSNNDGGDSRNEGKTTSTYIYQDFAQEADNDHDEDDDDDMNDVTAGNKQSPNQKLPKKLAAMLCDPGKRRICYCLYSLQYVWV